MTGRVYDTYVAALQHDLADVQTDATRVGVVRRPTPWLHAQVDENVPALAPPADLLDAVMDQRAILAERGVGDVAAHNRAMTDADFAERYRTHLDGSPDAVAARRTLRERLEAGEDLVLVCYENTTEKRCHRTHLRERIAPDDSHD